MKVNSRKVAVIGCGFVGSSSAFALMQSGLFSEMVLIDADTKRAEGEAMDISHGISFARPMQIYAGNYDDITDAAIIVITAGANQKPDETRLDLIKKNAAIMKSIVGEIKKRDFGGILLIVSNPVDILTLIALKESGYPSNRVIGSGTVLDTGRFKYLLGEHLDVDSRSVHAFIIGEHGDSELAAWSSATVSGVPINTFCEMRGHFNHDEATERIAENVKNSEIRLQSETAVFLYMFRCPEGHRFIFYQAGSGCMGNMTACIWRKQTGREMFYGYKNCSDRHYCGRPFQKRGTESAAP